MAHIVGIILMLRSRIVSHLLPGVVQLLPSDHLYRFRPRRFSHNHTPRSLARLNQLSKFSGASSRPQAVGKVYSTGRSTSI
jgi:hypothetical protein